MNAAPRVIDLPVIGTVEASTLVSKGIGAVVVVVAAAVLYAIGRRAIARAAHPKYAFPEKIRARADTTRSVLLSLWRYLVIFGAIGGILALLPSTFAHAIAITGLAGALLLLAAQAMFRDVVAGVGILLEGQFAVGDRVRLFGVEVEGTVEDVGLRITVIKEDSGSRVFVPNGAITAVRAIEGAASGKPEDGRRSRGGGRTRSARTRPPSRTAGERSGGERTGGERAGGDRPREAPVSADGGDDDVQTSTSSDGTSRPRTRRGGRRGRRGGRGRRPAGAGQGSGETSDAAPSAPRGPASSERTAPDEPPKPAPITPTPPPDTDAPKPEEPRDVLSDSPWSIE